MFHVSGHVDCCIVRTVLSNRFIDRLVGYIQPISNESAVPAHQLSFSDHRKLIGLTNSSSLVSSQFFDRTIEVFKENRKKQNPFFSNMKVAIASSLLLLATTAQGFTTVQPPCVGMTQLSMSDAVAEPEVSEAPVEIPSAPPAELSGLRMKDVRNAVANLDKDNFDKTLKDIEPYLTNEAGSALYNKSMRRIQVRANALGLQVPEGYAAEAKATQKKREKQSTFIQMKEEERLAAEGAAAEEEGEGEQAPAEEAADA
jgi:hypothetical protein